MREFIKKRKKFFLLLLALPICGKVFPQTPGVSSFSLQKASTGKLVTVGTRPLAPGFYITVTNTTCKNLANGTINIIANQSLKYTATLTAKGLNKAYLFTDSTRVTNLAAGTYNICITIAGQDDFQRCLTTTIEQPRNLAISTSVSPSGDQVVVAMEGGETYKIILNGVLHITNDNQITLPLNKGVNSISVSTDEACQGTVVKSVNVSPEILVYPNPFNNNINLSLGKDNLSNAVISVINANDGRSVYSNVYNNVTGITQIDLSALSSGLYLLRISGDNVEKVFKILKK